MWFKNTDVENVTAHKKQSKENNKTPFYVILSIIHSIA